MCFELVKIIDKVTNSLSQLLSWVPQFSYQAGWSKTSMNPSGSGFSVTPRPLPVAPDGADKRKSSSTRVPRGAPLSQSTGGTAPSFRSQDTAPRTAEDIASRQNKLASTQVISTSTPTNPPTAKRSSLNANFSSAIKPLVTLKEPIPPPPTDIPPPPPVPPVIPPKPPKRSSMNANQKSLLKPLMAPVIGTSPNVTRVSSQPEKVTTPLPPPPPPKRTNSGQNSAASVPSPPTPEPGRRFADRDLQEIARVARNSPARSAPLTPPITDSSDAILDPLSELIQTERNFISDLTMLRESYFKPIRAKELLSTSVLENMELNIERLLSFHTYIFSCVSNDSSVNGLINVFTPDFLFEMERLYTIYMGHYEHAIQIFYERRDSVSQFRKFLKTRGEDKSIGNLLVTPVQRVCKYELMLHAIHKQIKDDPANQTQAQKLFQVTDAIKNTLQNVDYRRAAADCWEQIRQLEKQLLVSEPLAKLGRKIILDTDVQIKFADIEPQPQNFKLVLFNDLLIRTKIPKRNKRGRVLDSIALSQLRYIADNRHSTPEQPHCIQFVNADPQSAVWFVYFASQQDKDSWLEELKQRTPEFREFSKEWRIPFENETLVCADRASWPQEYISDCRLYLTTNYLCILWKMFGATEREKLPIQNITSVKRISPKAKDLLLTTTGWKSSYIFVNMQNIEFTESVLSTAIQAGLTNPSMTVAPKTNPKRHIPALVLTPVEWNNVWSLGKLQVFSPNTQATFSQSGILFQVLKGSVTVSRASKPPITFNVGQIFGVGGFLKGFANAYQIQTSATSETHLSELRRDQLSLLDAQTCSKFFASLAVCFAPV